MVAVDDKAMLVGYWRVEVPMTMLVCFGRMFMNMDVMRVIVVVRMFVPKPRMTVFDFKSVFLRPEHDSKNHRTDCHAA